MSARMATHKSRSCAMPQGVLDVEPLRPAVAHVYAHAYTDVYTPVHVQVDATGAFYVDQYGQPSQMMEDSVLWKLHHYRSTMWIRACVRARACACA